MKSNESQSDGADEASIGEGLSWHAGVMSGVDRSLIAMVLRCVTGVIEWPYRVVMSLRNFAYDGGLKRAHRVKPAVISVGNLTTGGTGKTPMVIHITRMLVEAGHTPAVLLRGYKAGVGGDSDEQRELREALGEVPVIADPDRVGAARRIAEQIPEVDVIVLDDGFQHRRLARDLDVVLLDTTEPFGYGHVLPRGLMRESASELRRAGVLVLTHAERGDVGGAKLDLLLRTDREPDAITRHAWTGAVDDQEQWVSREEITKTDMFAFCGIGNPGAFLAMAGAAGHVAGYRIFGDHHGYTASDVEQLVAQAEASGAGALVTTRKDWVKVQSLIDCGERDLPVWRAALALEFDSGLNTLRDRVIQAVKDKAELCKT